MGTTPNGEFATETKSTTVITASGMVFVMKLGHWVSRDIYNEVALDDYIDESVLESQKSKKSADGLFEDLIHTFYFP